MKSVSAGGGHMDQRKELHQSRHATESEDRHALPTVMMDCNATSRTLAQEIGSVAQQFICHPNHFTTFAA
ncbi:hypothetical protein TNCV_1210301 [Trichonephila clavipes]|nr:hypothetical protein TNCV_1210301 [Trichonephila clavipes]